MSDIDTHLLIVDDDERIRTLLAKFLMKNGFLDWPKAKGFAERVIEAFDVRTPGPENAARSLSGGNLQKFVIGREVAQNPSVLVVNQPTWGVDAAAAAAIRQALTYLKRQTSVETRRAH